MAGNARYVDFDFNKKPLPLMSCMFVRLLVRGHEISKARVPIAKKGSKAILGRDWLIALRYKVEQPMAYGELQISQKFAQPEEQPIPEVEEKAEEFPFLLKRFGIVNN